MPASRSAIFTFRAALPLRRRCQPRVAIQLNRPFSDTKDDAKPSGDIKGPNMEQLPHVSEEAAATAKVTGDTGPDLRQGTPVQEVSYLLGQYSSYLVSDPWDTNLGYPSIL